MPPTFSRYSAIALVNEIESAECPIGIEKRVALLPRDDEYLKKTASVQTAEQ
ncbi:hypothetical protein [Colwellia piezophila]|uniref:hypothetical protein n=1 Tax=Colwellia piezophila TaxID=211668 RepID=UPI000364D672|nr:hypothetical protein [Colwellia piezophila]